jgi:hypothetical protein
VIIIPLTPSKDKKAIWGRIRAAPEIMKLMGWDKATKEHIAKHMIMRKPNSGLLQANERFIFIYQAPSRTAYSSAFLDCVIQVDVMVPTDKSDTADQVAELIVPLLTRKTGFEVNNRPLIIDAQVGDSPAPAGFYCYSMRFHYYSSV